jgi:chromosome segregation ATPase
VYTSSSNPLKKREVLMALEENDFSKIRKIVQEIVDESQEKLARMIAKELLGIRDELSKARREKPEFRSEMTNVRLDQEVLKARIQNIELNLVEHRKDTDRVVDRLESLERELSTLRESMRGT